MKTINARTILQMGFFFSWFIAVAVVGHAYAGDYYIYQDRNGSLVLSNNAPPPDNKIIKKESLSEVTDQQIAESRVREESAEFDHRLSSLEETTGELAENLRVQSEVNGLQQGGGDTNIAVGVTQGPPIITKAPHGKIERQRNFKKDLPNQQSPGTVPAWRQQRSAGRAG
jgi:hypothetical protein